MKKTIISFMATMMCCMNMNAQYVKLYNNGKLVNQYAETDVDEVVFAEEADIITNGATGGHRWVQLWENGPKFAEMNVGSAVSDYEGVTSYNVVGGHYTWGGSIDNDAKNKYNEDVFDLSGDDDTATKLWGSSWRMPTRDDLLGLLDNCIWTWCDGNIKQYAKGCTLKGYKVTGKGDYSGVSIFLPALGFCYEGNSQDLSSWGHYWSSTSTTESVDSAYELYFASDRHSVADNIRDFGDAVRAVVAE